MINNPQPLRAQWEVNYRLTIDGRNCHGCDHLLLPDPQRAAHCKYVEDPIMRNGVCDLWQRKTTGLEPGSNIDFDVTMNTRDIGAVPLPVPVNHMDDTALMWNLRGARDS